MIDLYIETAFMLMSRNYNFNDKYNMSLSLMISLIDHRKYLILDRLPAYLANLRVILESLCMQSHTKENSTGADKDVLDYAFQFEKLVRKICYLKRDMTRRAPYLIADILKQYEKTVFVHGVKVSQNINAIKNY